MPNILTAIKGYRTVAVNALIAVVALLVGTGLLPTDFSVDPETLNSGIDQVIAGVAALMAFVNIVLRLFTTTPLGQK